MNGDDQVGATPLGDAVYWRARAEAAERTSDRLAEGLRTILNGWPWLTDDPLTIEAVTALFAYDERGLP